MTSRPMAQQTKSTKEGEGRVEMKKLEDGHSSRTMLELRSKKENQIESSTSRQRTPIGSRRHSLKSQAVPRPAATWSNTSELSF